LLHYQSIKTYVATHIKSLYLSLIHTFPFIYSLKYLFMYFPLSNYWHSFFVPETAMQHFLISNKAYQLL